MKLANKVIVEQYGFINRNRKINKEAKKKVNQKCGCTKINHFIEKRKNQNYRFECVKENFKNI